MKNAKLTKFLANLAQDPKLAAAFKDDPDGCMDAAGLSKKHKKALKSGDKAKVVQLVNSEVINSDGIW